MEYTNNKLFKPNLKKCKDCGKYGEPNRQCKYWKFDSITEWSCSHPQAIKNKEMINNEKL